ncbi:MAG: hypothetical protein AB7M93_25955 [Candidatus Obscuribacterales bacterium]
MEKKIRHLMIKRKKRKGLGWKRWSSSWIYGELGLYRDYAIRYQE